MPFRPLIVVILLIFLALLSFALFVWSLLAMGRDRELAKEQETKQQKQAERRPNIRERGKSRQADIPAKERPKIGYLSKKELAGEAKSKPKNSETKIRPTIPPYQELRPSSKNRASSSAKTAKQRMDDIKTSEGLEAKNTTAKPALTTRPSIKDIKLRDITAKKDKPKPKTIEPKQEASKPEPKEAKPKTKDSYRGLNATKEDKKKDSLDPFDSFVEANKKLG